MKIYLTIMILVSIGKFLIGLRKDNIAFKAITHIIIVVLLVIGICFVWNM